MAILYQSKGSGATADARFNENVSGCAPGLRSSTFFNKHIRIVKILPSDDEMLSIVNSIWEDRMKSPATLVIGPQGESRKKSVLYGNIKPPGNTTLFVTMGGFESLNAYIEENVNTTSEHCWVPIPGGGVVAGKFKDKDSGTIKTQLFRSGFWEISVEVGPKVEVHKGARSLGEVTTKLVYHFGNVKL